VARGFRKDGECVDCSVGTRTDDVVIKDASGWVDGVSWAAPGRSDSALLNADDGAGKAGFEDGGGGAFVRAFGGVVETGDGGTLFVVDEDDGVGCCVGGGDVNDEVGGAAAFAAIGKDALELVFPIGFYDDKAKMGVLECGDVDVRSADCNVNAWRWEFDRCPLGQSVYSQ
jgi:hypothetical protein